MHHLATGLGWATLHLVGAERPLIILTALPGATVVFAREGPLPRPLQRALERGGPPAPALGQDHVFAGAELWPSDLVLALRLRGPAGERLLLHQLFGNPGNVVLRDAHGRVLWALRRPPHPCLLEPAPAPAAAATAAAGADPGFLMVGLARLLRQRETEIADRVQRALQRRQASARRLVEHLGADLAGAEQAERLRRDAEALAASLPTVKAGAREITLADLRDGAPRRIALDPALTAAGNLEHLFKLARKADRGRDVIAARLDQAVIAAQSAAHGLDQLAAIQAGDDDLARLDALLDFAAAAAPLLGEQDRGAARTPDEPTRPFRRYRLAGRWEVWIGRSGKENDELTLRASHPRDLWLHAQGVPGSHVVIRTGSQPENVPRAVIEMAAQLAAWHSRARHSGLVPVVWTQRRFVRKPRKAAPGQVACLQEKSVFVSPGIPADAVPI